VEANLLHRPCRVVRATQQLHLQLNPGRGHDRRVGVTVGEGSDPHRASVGAQKGSLHSANKLGEHDTACRRRNEVDVFRESGVRQVGPAERGASEEDHVF